VAETLAVLPCALDSAVEQVVSVEHAVPLTVTVIVMLAVVRFEAELLTKPVVLEYGVLPPRLSEKFRAPAATASVRTM
jgi:hypothetical protein